MPVALIAVLIAATLSSSPFDSADATRGRGGTSGGDWMTVRVHFVVYGRGAKRYAPPDHRGD
jgi:hypothetical protein